MGIFSRISQALKANINHLLSKAENPEKMLNQVMIEMQEQYAQAKKQVTVTVAQEKRLQKKYLKEKEQTDEWTKKARLALKKGNEELAKEALLRKNQHSKLASEYKIQWEKQKKATETLKSSLRNLENKIEEAKRKKDLLIAKQRRAEAQKNIHEAMSGVNDTSAFDIFAKMEEKVEQIEAEADAAEEMAELEGDNLEDEFKQLEESSVDDDLLALKNEMGLLTDGSDDA